MTDKERYIIDDTSKQLYNKPFFRLGTKKQIVVLKKVEKQKKDDNTIKAKGKQKRITLEGADF